MTANFHKRRTLCFAFSLLSCLKCRSYLKGVFLLCHSAASNIYSCEIANVKCDFLGFFFVFLKDFIRLSVIVFFCSSFSRGGGLRNK